MGTPKDTYINVPCSALYSNNTGPCLRGKFKHPFSAFFSVVEGAWGTLALFVLIWFSLIFFSDGDQALVQFTQGGCGISTLGESHKSPCQLALGVPT